MLIVLGPENEREVVSDFLEGQKVSDLTVLCLTPTFPIFCRKWEFLGYIKEIH